MRCNKVEEFIKVNANHYHLQYTKPMIICICQRVSDRDIARMSRSGASFDDLQLELGVATQCRACEGCARELHTQCQSSGAVAFCRSAHPAPSMPMVYTSPLKLLPLQAA
jgi:bacterioferritin-associated ferredoxin